MNIQQAQADGLSADEDASAYAETDACRGRFPVGTPEYHLQAIETYQEEIFQLLAAMLPDLYDASDEGSTPPEVIARIMATQQAE
jgi:hypothetical protein